MSQFLPYLILSIFADPDEKYDVIPEVWNGKNVADYIDPDIMAKLDALEKEEELRDKSGFYESEESESETEEMKEIREMASKIRVKKKIMKVDQKIDGTKKPTLPRTAAAAKRSRYHIRLFFEQNCKNSTGQKLKNFKTQAENSSQVPKNSTYRNLCIIFCPKLKILEL